jgi:DNA polymerase-3 subunit gamma/tau
VTRDHVERLLRLLAAGDAAALLQVAAELDELAPDYGQVLDSVAALLERLALQQLVPGYAPDEQFPAALVASLATAISREDVQLWYQTAIIGRRDLALAPEPRVGFRMTLLRMLAFRPEGATRSAGAVAPAKIQAPPPSQAQSQAEPPAQSPAQRQADAGTVPSAGMPAAGWVELIGALDLDGPARMLALNCALVATEPGLVRLALDPRNAAARTRSREERLTQALSRHFGAATHIEFVAGAPPVETPAQGEERASRAALAEAQSGLEADATVRALRDRFGATINADSVRPRGN